MSEQPDREVDSVVKADTAPAAQSHAARNNHSGRRKLVAAISSITFLLLIGTVFYTKVEGWSLVDSFYFTTVTLTTIGYGDIHPITSFGKLFTAFFAISGVAITLYSLTVIGTDYFARRERVLLGIVERRAERSSRSVGARMLRVDRHLNEALKKIDRQIKK